MTSPTLALYPLPYMQLLPTTRSRGAAGMLYSTLNHFWEQFLGKHPEYTDYNQMLLVGLSANPEALAQATAQVVPQRPTWEPALIMGKFHERWLWPKVEPETSTKMLANLTQMQQLLETGSSLPSTKYTGCQVKSVV